MEKTEIEQDSAQASMDRELEKLEDTLSRAKQSREAAFGSARAVEAAMVQGTAANKRREELLKSKNLALKSIEKVMSDTENEIAKIKRDGVVEYFSSGSRAIKIDTAQRRSQLSEAEKLQYISRHGMNEYTKLKF